jgi:hypothetical protein
MAEFTGWGRNHRFRGPQPKATAAINASRIEQRSLARNGLMGLCYDTLQDRLELSGAMRTWKRIPDDQPLSLDRREHRFSFPGGSYAIIWDPSWQHTLTVDYDGSREKWSVNIREIADDEVRLSGMADWVPEILGEACWFELVIGNQPSITYWGDRVIYRQDFQERRED